MSKFSKGDIVDVAWGDERPHRGIVHLSWGSVISDSGIPMVDVFLFNEGFIGHFDEEQVELALCEYEFVALKIDPEDGEQMYIGEWGTLEEAEKDILTALEDDLYDGDKLQVNRRRKAGPTIGYKAYRS